MHNDIEMAEKLFDLTGDVVSKLEAIDGSSRWSVYVGSTSSDKIRYTVLFVRVADMEHFVETDVSPTWALRECFRKVEDAYRLEKE